LPVSTRTRKRGMSDLAGFVAWAHTVGAAQ
jgi:hypothetical protein